MKFQEACSKFRKYLPLAIIPLVFGVVLALWLNLGGGNLVAVTTMKTVLVFAFSMAASICIATKEVESAIKTRERLAADNASLMRLDKMRANLIANANQGLKVENK